MQYDKDMQGEFADIFKRVQEIVLEFSGVKKKKSEHHTSYVDRYQSIIHLRTNDNNLNIAFAKGAKLINKYPFLKGDGSVVRHITIQDKGELNETLLREMIEETMILNMEHYEMKKLRKKL